MLRSSFSVDDGGACFKVLEAEAHSEGMRIARERLSERLELLEKQMHASRPPGLRVVGWRSRRLLTKIGETELRRRYYVDAQGNRVCLLDEHLEISPNRRVSAGLAEVAVVLSSEHSYRSSARLIEHLLGVRIEAETAHAEVQRVGSEILREQQQIMEEVLSGKAEIEPGSKRAEVLMLEVYGVNIRLGREGTQRSVEIKNGIAYDGWEKHGNVYRLTNRQRYAMIGNSDKFWDMFGLRIHQTWDISGVGRVVIGGDGASWVKAGFRLL